MKYPQQFVQSVEFTLGNEGGYVFDKDDPGGETNFGISRRSYPEINIKSLTRDGAMAIYYRDFWNPLYERIPSTKVMVRLFDTGVNMGPHVAVAILQTTMRHFFDLPHVYVDGNFGLVTLEALTYLLDKNCSEFYEVYRDVLNTFYIVLTLLGPKRKKYLHGWENRLNKPIQ